MSEDSKMFPEEVRLKFEAASKAFIEHHEKIGTTGLDAFMMLINVYQRAAEHYEAELIKLLTRSADGEVAKDTTEDGA
jgi:hypothetical protein